MLDELNLQPVSGFDMAAFRILGWRSSLLTWMKQASLYDTYRELSARAVPAKMPLAETKAPALKPLDLLPSAHDHL